MIRGTTRCRQFGRASSRKAREGAHPQLFSVLSKTLRYIPLVKLVTPPVDQFPQARLSILIRRTTNKLRIARHPTTIRWEPPLASAPAVSKFGGIVLSQCGAACV